MTLPDSLELFACCEHCDCGTPEGVWAVRDGHDDTCAHGCNDQDTADADTELPR